ncbi:MAG: L-histidine N(alpha)-methyltransferase [Acidobacteria bacterium]|nr:L-histidine N(alpha)-methyltransferase [Acidobacteriota bacterium]
MVKSVPRRSAEPPRRHSPWYRITRAENALLARHGAAIVAAVRSRPTIVELGCGSGEKLALLADALLAAGDQAQVHLIDISAAALAESERRLDRFPHVSVVGHRSTYEEGLRRAAQERRGAGAMLVLLLGSNIGNFDRPAAGDFLQKVRATLRAGDALLLGADLVKPEHDLLLAYDDPLGVTAAFNKNLLVRINRELGGRFDLGAFAHRAVWNGSEGRVEMHLVSSRAQRVVIEACQWSVSFDPGEWIWTESSYKYEPGDLSAMGASAGLAQRTLWIERDARFALTLFEAI